MSRKAVGIAEHKELTFPLPCALWYNCNAAADPTVSILEIEWMKSRQISAILL